MGPSQVFASPWEATSDHLLGGWYLIDGGGLWVAVFSQGGESEIVGLRYDGHDLIALFWGHDLAL